MLSVSVAGELSHDAEQGLSEANVYFVPCGSSYVYLGDRTTTGSSSSSPFSTTNIQHLFTMADVRSMLKHERAGRRVQHKYATYSTTGTLICTVCNLQIKSDSLWDGHLRSAGHIMKASKLQEQQESSTAHDTGTQAETTDNINVKKRKASDEGAQGTTRKRKMAPELPHDFFDSTIQSETVDPEPIASPMKIDGPLPSRPATPLRASEESGSVPVHEPLKPTDVDEDEWAAFEADIAVLKEPTAADAVISAPAMTAAEVEARSLEESNATRKERHEAELEGDKEDAARKLEVEFEEMEGLEERVRRLREKREALRSKSGTYQMHSTAIPPPGTGTGTSDVEDDEDDEDDDDGWDGFRLRN